MVSLYVSYAAIVQLNGIIGKTNTNDVPIIVPTCSKLARDTAFSALTLFMYTTHMTQLIFAPMCYICLESGCHESNIPLLYVTGITNFHVCSKCCVAAKRVQMHIRFALLCPRHVDIRSMIIQFLVDL